MKYGQLTDYADATPEARAVYDDIKAKRGVPDVNNAWKAMARHPAVMKRFWERAQQVMAPGALDGTTPVRRTTRASMSTRSSTVRW